MPSNLCVKTILFGLLFSCRPLLWASSLNVQVGILDEFSRFSALPANTYWILPLFQKVNEKWVDIDSSIASRDWDIYFDGKSIGKIKSESSNKLLNPHIPNLHKVIGIVTHPDGKSWERENGRFGHRPLVLIGAGHIHDPDSWKPGRLSKEAANKLIEAFRKKYPKVDNCSDHLSEPKAWKYKNSDIQMLKTYQSQTGNFLTKLKLNGDRCGVVPDLPFQPQYFGILKNGQVTFLSLGLKLIDAGDFDGDGKSELLFADSSEGGDDDNSDGYSLWNSEFQRVARRLWFYH